MKKIYSFLLLSLLSFQLIIAENSVGEWKIYLSYFDTDKIVDTKNIVFAVGSGALYLVNKEDNSIETYSKLTGLSDSDITLIGFNTHTNSLLIIYENGNIDVFTKKSIRNIPDFKINNSVQDKIIKNIYFKDEKAYLSTSAGVMVVNMNKFVIEDTYPKNTNTTSICIDNNDIYISTHEGVLTSTLNKNLLDVNNWNEHPLETTLFTATEIEKLFFFDGKLCFFIKYKGLYYENTDKIITRFGSDLIDVYINDGKLIAYNSKAIYVYKDVASWPIYVQYNGIKYVSSISNTSFWIGSGEKGLIRIDGSGKELEKYSINSPKRNLFFYTIIQNDKLFVVGGGRSSDRFNLPGTFMIMDIKKEEWYNYEEEEIRQQAKLNKSNDYMSVAVDPLNSNHYFVSSWGEGVYEFEGTKVKLHDCENSTLESSSTNPENMKNYIRVDGLCYDKYNNLWMTNSGGNVNGSIKVYTSEGEWKKLEFPESFSRKSAIGKILITSKEQKWVIIPRPSEQIGIFIFDDKGSIDNVNKNDYHFFSNFYDQDDKLVDVIGYFSIAEDKNGVIWVGTNQGLILFNNPTKTLTDKSNKCSRIKIPYPDDETRAYYMLENDKVTAIAVDGGNRKWIGTESSGIYLLSENGTKIIKNFNVENSPLISNNILSISIDDHTGNIFIGASNGLMSYRDVATEGYEDYSDVYVFPNPIREDFVGTITVTGLKENSFVKITDLNGNLICQGKSLGGQFGWNGENLKTGIYLVFAIDEENGKKESVVAKAMVIK